MSNDQAHKPFTEDDETLRKDRVDVITGEIMPAGTSQLMRQLAPQEVIDFLTNTKPETVDDPEAAAISIIARILSAETAEEVGADQEVIHAGEILNVPLTVLEVKWNASDYTEGAPMYALATATRDDTGERILFTCGGLNAMAQLYRWGQLDAFPLPCHIEEAAKPTKRGYRPMWLRMDVDRVPSKG